MFCLRNVTSRHAVLLKNTYARQYYFSDKNKIFFWFLLPFLSKILTRTVEATFNFIKVVTNLTSNHHPSNIIANAIIRMQAKNILNEGLHHESKESALNEAYQSIKSRLKNTVIPYIWIKKKLQISVPMLT